jgi:hypothetical protein
VEYGAWAWWTELAEGQVPTIRTKLLKIGAKIRLIVRKVGFRWLPVFPGRTSPRQVWANLRC